MSDGALAAHRVDGDDRSFDRQRVQIFWDRDDLIGFFHDFRLARCETLSGGKGGNHMNGTFTSVSAGPALGLAVDRHHTDGNANQRRNPDHEAALELLGVEGREDVTEMVVVRRAAEEWPEAPENSHFHTAEPGDINEGFGSGQDREQCQEKHLLKWMHDFARLAVVGQTLEMIKEHNRSRRELRDLPSHRPWSFPCKRIQRAVIDSTFQGFVPYFFTRLAR